MAIGKISGEKIYEGVGNDRHQIVHIILLPTFPANRYGEVQPGKQLAAGLSAGNTLWAESGQQLEVTDAAGYPYLSAKALDEGNTYGKVTNDDKEALVWLRKIGNDLLPSNVKGIPLWTGLAQWEIKWKPLKEALDNAEHADQARVALHDIRIAKDGPQTSFGRPYAGGPSVIATSSVSGATAVKEAGKQLKDEAKSWWDDIGPGWKYGAAAVGLVVGAMYISEKVK